MNIVLTVDKCLRRKFMREPFFADHEKNAKIRTGKNLLPHGSRATISGTFVGTLALSPYPVDDNDCMAKIGLINIEGKGEPQSAVGLWRRN